MSSAQWVWEMAHPLLLHKIHIFFEEKKQQIVVLFSFFHVGASQFESCF